MRILQVNSAFPPAYSYGGGLRVLYDLSKELIARGHEVTVYTTDAYDSRSRLALKENPVNMEGIEVYRFRNISNVLAHKNLSVAPALAFSLKENIRKFDLVHLHEYRSFHSIAVLRFAGINKIPYVLNAYSALPVILQRKVLKVAFDRFWGHDIAKGSRAFIAQSRREVADAERVGIDRSRIALVYNGIDVSRFRHMPSYGLFREKHGISENAQMLLFLGRIHKSKGVDFAIRGLSRVADRLDDVVFVIAGPDDGYQTQYEKLAKSLGLSDNVKFVGFVEESEKISAYHDSDLFIHTVEYMGGVGLTPLEAILCGTPAVVTQECGEIIEDAKCGYLVKYQDIEGLGDTIWRALSHPDETERMVELGRKYILENLDWRKVVERTERIYNSCLQQDKG